MPKIRRWYHRWRDAITGQMMTEEEGEKSPGSSVRERVERYTTIPIRELPTLRVLLSDGLELTYDSHTVEQGVLLVQFSEARVQPPPHRRGGDD